LQAWGGSEISVAQAESFGQAMAGLGAGGLMMWSTYKTGPPSALQLAQAACRSLAMGNCSIPLI
jgi:hypothetical protein